MPKRILIVDDRDDLRALLADAFAASGADLEIEQAADGAQALARHAERRVDLVVTDLDMPVMNGVELIRRLRAEPPAPAIIVISGASAEWIAGEAALELRDLPFLRKPLALGELIATATALLT
jgi:DNA-binding response OmpR family regulator